MIRTERPTIKALVVRYPCELLEASIFEILYEAHTSGIVSYLNRFAILLVGLVTVNRFDVASKYYPHFKVPYIPAPCIPVPVHTYTHPSNMSHAVCNQQFFHYFQKCFYRSVTADRSYDFFTIYCGNCANSVGIDSINTEATWLNLRSSIFIL